MPHAAHPLEWDAPAGTIDVAIVAYRSWKHTRSCLEHLRRQSIAHRVYVCDNGCDEGTAERIRRDHPEVTVLRMERNLRYAIACNSAVAAGHGELVVMMNNDVNPRPDFLERLTAPFAGHPRLGSVAALLLRPGEERIDSAGLVADRTLSGFPRLRGHPLAEAPIGPPPSAPVSASEVTPEPVLTGPDGAAAAFRRAAWEQMGGLDESIHGMDDFDLVLRLRAAGWETALAHDAVAVHIGSATYGHRSVAQRHRAGFGRAYLLRRYGVLRSRSALRALGAEAIVVVSDLILARDTAAFAGRWAGWRAAAVDRTCARPPREAIDERIGFLESLRLRRGIYMPAAGGGPAEARPR
jgi:N-acetylglucosaminyl-diphospho-decaprenol L-rhamnosyltransferase